jgi:hypothetical protein
MAKSYDVYGTSSMRKGETIILLSEGYTCQSSAEQGMRWCERQGSKHCKVVPTDKQSDNLGMSFEELIS